MATSSWILYVAAIALTLLSGRSTAQELCSCSPSTYKFTLDFSLTCPPVSVTKNPAITATFCQISPLGDANETITDLVPVEVDSLAILELGQEFEVLSQKNVTGPFTGGDSFEYTSLIDADGYDGEAVKVIQLNIFGENAAGKSIVNFFAISFTNTCDEYPALIEGDSAGWTTFVSLFFAAGSFWRQYSVETFPFSLETGKYSFRIICFEPPTYFSIFMLYHFRPHWGHLP